MHNKKLSLVFGGILLAATGDTIAHSNFVENPVDGSRNFVEQRRYFLKLNLAHTCGHGGVNYDIIHAGILFPNGLDTLITHYEKMTAAGGPDENAKKTILPDLSNVLQTYDAERKPAGANGVMAIKPILNANFGQIIEHRGSVPGFYNHGARTTDVRAIYWLDVRGANGKLGMNNNNAENLEFVTTLGRLQGCVAKVRVFTPAIDYCADGNVYAWTRDNTKMLTKDLVTASGGKLGLSSGYAPSFDIVRNNQTNPLPSSCAQGEMVTVYPSETDIDHYLSRFAPDWIKQGSRRAAQQCPEGQHWMGDHCMDNNAM